MIQAGILFTTGVFGTSGCLMIEIMSLNLTAFGRERQLKSKIQDPIRPDARLAVLWVGHATAHIQIDNKFVLTKPVVTDTVGPLSPRLVEPRIDVEAWPPLDAVLVSHRHFDHMLLGAIVSRNDTAPRQRKPRLASSLVLR